jgi:hypothetical protein
MKSSDFEEGLPWYLGQIAIRNYSSTSQRRVNTINISIILSFSQTIV